jgi:phosphomannomutase / phosphoglucomutase
MKIPEHIFREYDIRGTVDIDLSDEFARLLGQAFAGLMKENGKKDIVIGWDCRLSSPGYAMSLAKGLAGEGIDVVLTGMGPTPQLYYSIFSRKAGAGIQVTGSHNPADMNGFKLCLGTQTLSGENIQDLKRRVLKVQQDGKSNSSSLGKIDEVSMRESYTKELIQNSLPHMGKRKLKVVVDAGNGVGGLVGPAVLKGLGVEVVELYCEPDGRFPNHHPDPTVLKNIQALIKKVKEEKADFGIGWDGDADRIGVVDEKGEIIFGDMLLLIYGRAILQSAILQSAPKVTIIGDVKCSSLLFDELKKLGANSVMWKTGHSLIKGKLKELNADLAGEMSGHIFFKHRYYGFDDAIYSSARFAEIVSHSSKQVSEMLSDLPKMVSTPEIRVDCPEEIKFKIIEEAQKAFPEYVVNPLDGARISFSDGWGLVRASNTQPVLVMRFEATNHAKLEEYQKLVTERIEEIKRRV